MGSLRTTVKYPEFTKDSIKAAMKSDMGQRTVWCVVEAPDDIAVYKNFLSSSVTLQPSDIDGKRGCRNVESIVSDLYGEFTDIKLFGIRDADYTRYTSYVLPANVFLTDARDIEMMMVSSDSVSSTLPEHALSKKIVAAAETARYLGYLRIFNEVFQTSCSFRNKVAKTSLMWCEQTCCVEEDYASRQFAAFKEECDSNPACPIEVTESAIEDFIAERELEAEPYYNVCRGHDVVKLLSRMLSGTCYSDHIRLERHIVQSYDIADFERTQLYSSIATWADGRGLDVFNQRS